MFTKRSSSITLFAHKNPKWRSQTEALQFFTLSPHEELLLTCGFCGCAVFNSWLVGIFNTQVWISKNALNPDHPRLNYAWCNTSLAWKGMRVDFPWHCVSRSDIPCRKTCSFYFSLRFFSAKNWSSTAKSSPLKTQDFSFHRISFIQPCNYCGNADSAVIHS